MKNHISSAIAATKTDQEDPIVMYLIVRSSIPMTSGKIAAQVGHSVQMLIQKYYGDRTGLINNRSCMANNVKHNYEIFCKWLDGSFSKVVLAANDKQFEQIKAEFEVGDIAVVIDAGLTQLEPMTETAIGIWPMHKSARPKILKKLQLLK